MASLSPVILKAEQDGEPAEEVKTIPEIKSASNKEIEPTESENSNPADFQVSGSGVSTSECLVTPELVSAHSNSKELRLIEENTSDSRECFQEKAANSRESSKELLSSANVERSDESQANMDLSASDDGKITKADKTIKVEAENKSSTDSQGSNNEELDNSSFVDKDKDDSVPKIAPPKSEEISKDVEPISEIITVDKVMADEEQVSDELKSNESKDSITPSVTTTSNDLISPSSSMCHGGNSESSGQKDSSENLNRLHSLGTSEIENRQESLECSDILQNGHGSITSNGVSLSTGGQTESIVNESCLSTDFAEIHDEAMDAIPSETGGNSEENISVNVETYKNSHEEEKQLDKLSVENKPQVVTPGKNARNVPIDAIVHVTNAMDTSVSSENGDNGKVGSISTCIEQKVLQEHEDTKDSSGQIALNLAAADEESIMASAGEESLELQSVQTETNSSDQENEPPETSRKRKHSPVRNVLETDDRDVKKLRSPDNDQKQNLSGNSSSPAI